MKIIPLTKKRKSLVNIMKEYALKSELRSKHCACLVKKNKILSIDYNKHNLETNKIFCSTHAEVSLDKNLNKYYIKRKKYDLWVIRYSKENTNGLTDSKPCSKCIDYIKKNMNYVHNIIYSNENGKLEKININEIENNHISLGYKIVQNRRNN